MRGRSLPEEVCVTESSELTEGKVAASRGLGMKRGEGGPGERRAREPKLYPTLLTPRARARGAWR